ncbi:MAG: hypothetical protein AB7E77_03355 [Desulfobulbus sp.]
MPFKWRATFNFEYPLLDKPIDVDGIKLYPAQPDNDKKPSCVNYYEFETNDVGAVGNAEAITKSQERLKELIELSSLAKYRTDVSLHSLILMDTHANEGFQAGGVNFNFGGGNYFPPGQNPAVIRQELENSSHFFTTLRQLTSERQKIIRRSLRWFYRASDPKLLGDEKLIYGWISFNSFYTLYKTISNHPVNSERGCIQEFEVAFRGAVGQPTSNITQLAQAGIQLTRGANRDVSLNLQNSIAANSQDKVHMALECIYAVRCSLFHGDEEPIIEDSDPLFMTCSRYLNEYLKNVMGPFITYCNNNP